MKVISFSLWGDSPVYNTGAIRNAELAREFYPGWECRFHCSRMVPASTREALKEFPHVRVINIDEGDSYRGLFWRFFPISDPKVEVVLSRDCDSRIEYREAMAVRDFLRSDKDFHILRDHPWHNVPILGGMFGVKRPLLAEMNKLIDQAPEYEPANVRLGADQDFLKRAIWPLVKDRSLVHDDVHEPAPWQVSRSGLRFVGQAFDENDRPLHPEHGRVAPPEPDHAYRIDLRDVPVFVVSGRKFTERQHELRQCLDRLGLRMPVFFQDEFGGKNRSNCQNHLGALSASPVPFLVLEDDARPTDAFRPLVEIPCGASALYLGTSNYGLTGAGAAAGTVMATGALSMPRVINMLSLHAVLYLDPSYVASTRKLLHDGVLQSTSPPSDVLVAAQMASWNVCALNPPSFYQNDGKNETCTRRLLKVIGSGQC